MAGHKKGAVFTALVGNGILTILKLVAFAFSGSGAMMSEAVHSFADTANQGLLYIGVRRSLKPADARFQYGYGAERYVFALLSAAGIFFLGCGVTVYHGVSSLMRPPELSISWLTFAALGVAVLVEGWVLVAAAREVNASRGTKEFWNYVRTTTDPTLVAVLFEDLIAVIGALVAMGGIALSYYTGNPVFDAVSSILIGTLLGLMAIWLGWRNRELILGPSMPDDLETQVRQFLRDQESVIRVQELRTRIVAADRFRIAAEVEYDGRHFGVAETEWLRERAQGVESDDEWRLVAGDFGERLLEKVGDEVDRIEAEMAERFPKIGYLDLEAD